MSHKHERGNTDMHLLFRRKSDGSLKPITGTFGRSYASALEHVIYTRNSVQDDGKAAELEGKAQKFMIVSTANGVCVDVLQDVYDDVQAAKTACEALNEEHGRVARDYLFRVVAVREYDVAYTVCKLEAVL